MSFTSFGFILVFLPLAYLGFLAAHRLGGWNWAFNFLALVSLIFYGMFGASLLLILLVSMLFNYTAGNILACLGDHPQTARNALFASIAANLGLLGYLKYTNFFVDVTNQLSGSSFTHQDILVPLGVSFFTFVQIGYLIDASNGQLMKNSIGRYIVFAAFFPCVTAGPLVLQREMMEQMENPPESAFNLRRLIVGLTMFGMGLFKKVVFADSIAPFANQVFDGVATGSHVELTTAWIGALAYTLQLYFDFSGYSDMAIGLGSMFGLKLPLNFDSPFKTTNISDFWRRWHMTMTRFFTSYIYSGLAMKGMRNGMKWQFGRVGRFVLVAAMPSIVTFIVAGVWHGSGWTYIVYGLWHGFAIAGFLAWREFAGVKLPVPIAWFLMMLVVVGGLVIFRSADMVTATHIFKSMLGVGQSAGSLITLDAAQALSMIVLFGAVTVLLPNTQQILHLDWLAIDTKPVTSALEAGLLTWRPALGSAFVSAILFTVALTSIGTGTSFLYYKF
jgi:alginate O-acetyltransferase complex protein AlgI